MSKSHTFAIAVDEQFTIHSTARSLAEKLGRQTTGSWTQLRDRIFAVLARAPRNHTTSNYYKSASDRVCWSAPVTSLRRVA
jgi:hypothetical protein